MRMNEAAPHAMNTIDPRRENGTGIAAMIPGVMKWSGWGVEGESFDVGGRPYFWNYAKRHLGISETTPRTRPVDVANIKLPPSRAPGRLLAALAGVVGAARCSTADADRLIHAYGKSTRDLWRIRNGRVDAAPDAVVFPANEGEVCALIDVARDTGAALIPFGGGSNVAGCVETLSAGERPVVTVNLRLMNRVLNIDRAAGTAQVQPGILGPDLEQALNGAGLTLGHFPDSFPYSSVGGWVAARSSGMLSDGYGNAEDMVLALRMATPKGMIATRCVPHASNGPNANHLCIGSEGTLGIITEMTMAVRPMPERREFHGYLFPSFVAGIEAIHDTVDRGVRPVLSRLNDPMKTQLLGAVRRRDGWWQSRTKSLMKAFLTHARGFDMQNACVMISAFQGDSDDITGRRRAAERVYRRHGGISLGRGPGDAFAESKYDFPYVRDFLMDYGVICDVAETSATWPCLGKLYDAAMRRIGDTLRRDGRLGWVGCHLSHSYSSGASLYFSYAFPCRFGADGSYDVNAELAYYARVKLESLKCFAEMGATLSHHHAVGYEHLPWLPGESCVAGGTATEAVKQYLDPTGIMNPGKLVSGFDIDRLNRLVDPPIRGMGR